MRRLLTVLAAFFLIANSAQAQCDATFTYTNIDCDSVWFVPASTGSQYVYFWDFGDGNTSMDVNPTNTYGTDGTYIVVLTIQDTVLGCFQSQTQVVNINCTGPCTVNGAWTWLTDSLGCTAYFTSTAFGGTPPYSYYWDFGDGNTSTLANPNHTYSPLGPWNVCLTITDAMGCDTTLCQFLTAGCAATSCDASFTLTHMSCDSVWFYPVSTGPQYSYFWDFGDGNTSTDADPTHVYGADGTYTVLLYLTDSVGGCTDVFTVPVTIFCGTSCTVNGAWAWNVDSINCDVNFVSTAFGGTPPYTYFWNFGDGNTSFDPHPTHNYPNNSSWTPCLTITDAMGCDTTICQVVNVNCSASCDATFTYTFAGCNQVYFFPVSTGSQYSYYWDFGDGNSSTLSNPTHLYTADGTYLVVLTITDSLAGCTNLLTVPITINCGFTPCDVNGAFSYYVDSITCETNFISTAFGGTPPYSYFWNFGDGNTSTLANPIHTYPNNTSYTPCLTITDINGCDTTICDVVYTNCNPTPCDAQFTYTFTGCNSVYFFPAASGGQYSYYWDFGDGNSSTQMNPIHTYTADGTYLTVLTIIDSLAGCSNSFTVPITINCGITGCTVNGAMSWFVDTTDCSVAFVSTAFGGTPPYTYYWNFGDGNVSTSPNPIHTYPNNSTWTPCLTITDSQGCDTTICDVVYVACSQSPCDASFQYTYTSCNEVIFVPTSMGGPNFYYWDFGDGNTSYDESPSHQYSADGTYTVVLVMTDSLTQCTQTYTQIVNVNCGTPCTINAVITAVQDSMDCTMQFLSSVSGGSGYFYYWDFGDSTFSTDPNPVHTFLGTGPYIVCLTVTDSIGCDTTVCMTVTVICNSIGFQEEGISDILVYPNPTHGEINVVIPSEGDLVIYDLSGKLVYSEINLAAHSTKAINLDHVERGMYILQFTSSGETVTKKIIKE